MLLGRVASSEDEDTDFLSKFVSMTFRSSFLPIVLAVIFVLPSCGRKERSSDSRTKGEVVSVRKMPSPPKTPSMVTDPSEVQEYVIAHFWDAFLDGSYRCDSNHINGVVFSEAEEAFAMYAALLGAAPFDFSRKEVGTLFSKVEKFESSNPSSNVFGFFEKMTSKYLYDPNSPTRDEDLYCQYVKRLASSKFVPEEMRPAYSNDARLCSMNAKGTKAADISFTDREGRRRNLHRIKAEHTLLFFTNPGCPACREIIQQLTENPRIDDLVAKGVLAVVNLYIDLDREEWKEYSKKYPSSWINGYDQSYTIRTDETYSVRAIPSLYILDADKRVVMKDAPAEKVLAYLEKL